MTAWTKLTMAKYAGITSDYLAFMKGSLEAHRRDLAKLEEIHAVVPSGMIGRMIRELKDIVARYEDSTTGKMKMDPQPGEPGYVE